VRITLANPAFTVVGSADDTDATNGPGTSFGPAKKPTGSCTDGASTATATCLNGTHLTADVVAQTGPRSSASAKANTKAEAVSTLTISYSFFDRLLRRFGLHRKLQLLVLVRMVANLADGPASASFAVFIAPIPAGAPVPAWSGSYSLKRDPSDAQSMIVTRQDGRQVTDPNPGRTGDSPDTKIELPAGAYRLTFEANSIATADGTVSLDNDCELRLRSAW
jgi:hypothetical protein